MSGHKNHVTMLPPLACMSRLGGSTNHGGVAGLFRLCLLVLLQAMVLFLLLFYCVTIQLESKSNGMQPPGIERRVRLGVLAAKQSSQSCSKTVKQCTIIYVVFLVVLCQAYHLVVVVVQEYRSTAAMIKSCWET